jgi:hypothetical protein
MVNTLFSSIQMKQGRHHLFDDIDSNGLHKTELHDEEFN